jgi:hypothetical protein
MAAATNLFNDDIGLLKEYVDFGANLTWAKVSSQLKRAERTYLRAIFGAYYTDLLTKIGEGTLVAKDNALLDEMRLASGNLAWWLFVPIHNVSISSAGIGQAHSEGHKPAFQWSVKDLQKSYRDAGFEAIENTFEFLEANNGIYEFDASEVRKAAKACIIATASEFQDEIDIMKSRYLYMQLIPEMKRIQRDVVRPIVGAAAFDTILKKLQKDNGEAEGANTLSDTEKIILAIARPLIANKTLADSLYKRSILFNEMGLLVHNSAFAGTVDGMLAADQNRIDGFEKAYLKVAETKLTELNELINPTAEKTVEQLTDINTFDPESTIGGFF